MGPPERSEEHVDGVDVVEFLFVPVGTKPWKQRQGVGQIPPIFLYFNAASTDNGGILWVNGRDRSFLDLEDYFLS
jgi:hypothetical protein